MVEFLSKKPCYRGLRAGGAGFDVARWGWRELKRSMRQAAKWPSWQRECDNYRFVNPDCITQACRSVNPPDTTSKPRFHCPDFIVTIMVPLWIMIYPRPYGMALLIAAIVPALCFVRITALQIRLGPYKSPISRFDERVFAAGITMILAMSVRVVFDVRLVEWPAYLLTVMLSTVILASVTKLCNRLRGVTGLEVLTFALYCAGTIGLANAHLDQSPPRYVQGTVTSIWSEGSGRGYREYYRIAPYLASDERIVELGPLETLDVKVGDPVCSTLHAGRFGFQRYEIRRAHCATVGVTRAHPASPPNPDH